MARETVVAEEGLDFLVEVAPECPASIETEVQRLEQVLKNLLSNAFKFTEAGRVSFSIQPADEAQLALSVSDTGIGITQEQQQNVFEAFHQADSTISRKYGGTGLGLSISQHLVRLLGGSIELKSRPGEGSTFTIKIPLSYDPAKVAPREPARMPGVTSPSRADELRPAPTKARCFVA